MVVVYITCRQEVIKRQEKERRNKYKKQDDEREVIRTALRDKVLLAAIIAMISRK